jgi:anti-sigma factor RsiW
MNNDPVYQRLREIAWRRKLTDAEAAELHAWLAAHPEAATEAARESALNNLLVRLPDAPVSSNFTARILQAIEREESSAAPRSRDWNWVWRVLVPRTAAAMLVFGLGAYAVQQYRSKQRAVIGDSLVTIATVPTMPSAQALEDFEVIQKLDSDSAADKELIALLQ